MLEQAVTDNTAVRLRYTDRNNTATERTVEPAGFYGTPDGWALAAWCQLRNNARLFRPYRIHRHPRLTRADRCCDERWSPPSHTGDSHFRRTQSSWTSGTATPPGSRSASGTATGNTSSQLAGDC